MPRAVIRSFGTLKKAAALTNASLGLLAQDKCKLIADAADSPIVRTIGSRNQFSGGVELTFTFNTGIRR